MALTFLQSTSSSSDLATYTFSSQNLGAETSDRHIIVCIAARKASPSDVINSVTIGGVSAAIPVQAGNAGNVVGIAIANVPTGVTGSIVVTFNSGMLRCGIGVYRANNLVSATAHDTDSSTASAPTVNLDVPIGFAIGVAMSTVSTNTSTWTGLNEDYDVSVETQIRFSGANIVLTASEAGRTLTDTFIAPSAPVGVFASWEMPPVTFTPKVVIF